MIPPVEWFLTPVQPVDTSNSAWSQIITLILGGAGVTLITTAVWAFNTLRTGARARAREILADLEAARDAAEDRARVKTVEAVFWQGIAGMYGYQLRRAGLDPEPSNPRPPSAANPSERGRRAQQGRVRRDAATTGELWIGEEGG